MSQSFEHASTKTAVVIIVEHYLENPMCIYNNNKLMNMCCSMAVWVFALHLRQKYLNQISDIQSPLHIHVVHVYYTSRRFDVYTCINIYTCCLVSGRM